MYDFIDSSNFKLHSDFFLCAVLLDVLSIVLIQACHIQSSEHFIQTFYYKTPKCECGLSVLLGKSYYHYHYFCTTHAVLLLSLL